MAAPGVTPLPDTPIDRFERVYCDGQYFGEPITLEQVYEAGRIENLPEGADYVTYQAVYPNSPNYIPKQFFSDDHQVVITLEMVGPPNEHFQMIPNDIRRAAGWVARQCVSVRQVGGFATLGREEAIRFPALIGDADDSFLGVTVATIAKDSVNYGNAEPRVMSDIAYELETREQENFDDNVRDRQRIGRRLYRALRRMRRTGGYWWDSFESWSPLPSLQSVSCNASAFGKPDEKSCYLMLQQLPPGNASLDVTSPVTKSAGPQSRGCVATIKADGPVSIAWTRIKRAIEDVLAICLHSPLAAIAGGMMATSALGATFSNPQLPSGVTVTVQGQ